jgi:multiple sugar transport system substrate-binding protein
MLLAVLAMIVAACGGTSSEETTAETGGVATTASEAPATTAGATDDTEAEAPAEGEVTLRWMTRPDNPEEAAVYESISNNLGLEGVSLAYEPGDNEGSSYQDKLLTNLSAGTAPDVFWIPGTDVARFVQEGVILDLREYAAATDHNDSDFYPGPMGHLTTDPATGQPGDRLWGLPRDVSTFGIYVNLDLVAEAGMESPVDLAANGEWTWEKFQEVSEGIAALGGDVKGYGQSNWWGPNGAWINAAGGNFFSDDRTSCALDSPEAAAGLTFVSDLYAGGSAVPFGEDPEPPFRAGTVGMFQNGRWATPGIRTVDFNWDVVGLPEGPAGPGNWLFWGAYVVNANTEHPEEAWALVQALTSTDVQAEISALGANIPSRVSDDALSAFLGFTPPENNQAFLDGLQNDPTTEGPLWLGSWPEFDAVQGPAIGDVISGTRTVEDFSANICSEAAAAFGS